MYKTYVVFDLKDDVDVKKIIDQIKQTSGIAYDIRNIEQLSDFWHREKKSILITAQLTDTSNTSIFVGEVIYVIADHVTSYRMMDVIDKRRKNQFKNE